VHLLRGATAVRMTDAMLKQPPPKLPAIYKAEIMTVSKQEDGKEKESIPTYVTEGKNLGKKNETNVITQALRDALGKYNKQKKRADTSDVKELKKESRGVVSGRKKTDSPFVCLGAPGATDIDPRPPPMLVKPVDSSKDATLTPEMFARGITAQRKYDGIRVVTFLGCDVVDGKNTPKVVLYSRTGQDLLGHEHIRREILPMLLAAPPIDAKTRSRYAIPTRFTDASEAKDDEDKRAAWAYKGPFGPPCVYIDAEIYLHGWHLNKISGQARKEVDEGKLELHVFDCFFPLAIELGHSLESMARQRYLDDFFKASAAEKHPHIIRVENFKVKSMEELGEFSKRFVKEGYEGVIARKNCLGYVYSYNGFHSANLVKLKPLYDDEFKVVGFTQGRKGKALGAVMWICEVDEKHIIDPEDKTFTVTPKGMTDEQRYSLYKCLQQTVKGPGGKKMTRFQRDFYGQPLTVEFPDRSAKTGKPQKAKATTFRTYEEGPEHDPIAKALKECDEAEKS
jgi:hypothetical protein